MLKCDSSQLMASGGVLGGERNSVIFEGPATGSLTMIQCIWSAHIGFGIYFFFYFGEWTQEWEGRHRRNGR